MPTGVRVFLASRPVDFRKGPDGLLSLVRDGLHEAIDQAAGGVVRCTVDGDLVGRRTLKLPIWMFDRAVYVGVRMASTFNLFLFWQHF